jgi:protease-4
LKSFSKFTLGCLGGIGVILLVLGILSCLFFALFADREFDLSGKTARLGLVKVEGPIFASEEVVEQIQKLEKAASVQGLLLRINTPGGGIAASQEIFQAVLDFKKTKRLVYASMGSLSASGGYYIACAADSIYANPGTITGSIGVIMEFPQAEKLLEKIGVQMEVIKSGKMKDAGAFNRSITPDEKRYLNDLIQDAYGQFLDAVTAHRPLTREQLAPLADGRLFTGRQALQYKLVDGLLSYEQAAAKLRSDCKLPADAEFVQIPKKENWWKKILDSSVENLAPLGLAPLIAYLMPRIPVTR